MRGLAVEGKLDPESGIDIYSAVGRHFDLFYPSAVGWFLVFNLIKAAMAAG